MVDLSLCLEALPRSLNSTQQQRIKRAQPVKGLSVRCDAKAIRAPALRCSAPLRQLLSLHLYECDHLFARLLASVPLLLC